MHDIKILRHVYVSDEDIDDIMASALEGGITYWCHRAEVIGEYLGEYASDQISRGGSLKLYCEGGVVVLTLDKFIKGISKWLYNRDDRYNAVLYDGTLDCGRMDAEAADVIIQYALFNEIIYG